MSTVAQTLDPTRPAFFNVPAEDRGPVLAKHAMDLWSAGYEVAAVVVARAAIDVHLRQVAHNDHRVEKTHHLRSVTVASLIAAGVVDRQTGKYLRQVLDIASPVAHGAGKSFQQMAVVIRALPSIMQIQPERPDSIWDDDPEPADDDSAVRLPEPATGDSAVTLPPSKFMELCRRTAEQMIAEDPARR